MDCVLAGLSYVISLVNLDDTIIFNRTFKEHIHRLNEVFQRIRQANLKLKPSKYSLWERHMELFRHISVRVRNIDATGESRSDPYLA